MLGPDETPTDCASLRDAPSVGLGKCPFRAPDASAHLRVSAVTQ